MLCLFLEVFIDLLITIFISGVKSTYLVAYMWEAFQSRRWNIQFVLSSTGDVEFQRAVPDTLTTWVASAFAVSNATGLGVGELKPQVPFICAC